MSKTAVDTPSDLPPGPSSDPESDHDSIRLSGPRSPRTSTSRRVLALCLFGWAAIFLLLRVVLLDADIDASLTESNGIVTDEGWYSNSAVRAAVGQPWHLPGDVNEAVVMPVFHVLQALTIGSLGFGAASARLLPVLLFFLLVVAAGLATWRSVGELGAAVVCALLATQYELFCYSRIAMVELPAMSLAVVAWAIAGWRPRRAVWAPASAGLVMALATLTKPTALVLLPAVLLLLWGPDPKSAGSPAPRSLPEWRDWWRPALALLVTVGTLVAFGLVSRTLYPDDWAFFERQLDLHSASSWTEIPRLLVWAFNDAARTEPLVFLAGAGLLLALVLWRGRGRGRERWMTLCLLALWFSCWLAIATSAYQPTRYFLPWIVASCMTFGFVAAALERTSQAVSRGLLLVGCAVAGLAGHQCASYLLDPSWTMAEATREVLEIAHSDAGEPLLAGNPAPTLALLGGVPAVSGNVSDKGLAWLVSRYGATHVVSLGELPEPDRAELSRQSQLLPRGRFPVFDEGLWLHVYELQATGSLSTNE